MRPKPAIRIPAPGERPRQAFHQNGKRALRGQLRVLQGKRFVFCVVKHAQPAPARGGHGQIEHPAAQPCPGQRRVQNLAQMQSRAGGADIVRPAQRRHGQNDRVRRQDAGGQIGRRVLDLRDAERGHVIPGRAELAHQTGLPRVAAEYRKSSRQKYPFFPLHSMQRRARRRMKTGRKRPLPDGRGKGFISRLFLCICTEVQSGQPMNHWVQYPPSAT